MNWSYEVKKVTPFIVRIQTQQNYGTGLIFWQNKDLCCIATANHVIESANIEGWEQPIYLHQPNGKELRLNPEHRRIIPKLNEEIDGDSAAILIYKSGLDFPTKCLPLWDFSREIPIGTEVGWLGYPCVVNQRILTPSFFSGPISNHFPDLQQYAIDGVSIHGVSGGPLFCKFKDKGPYVMGTISSYFANRVPIQGSVEAWPGLALSHSFSAFIPIINDLNSLEEIDHTETSHIQKNAPA